MKPRIMYIEQKTGESRAWIGRVTFSRTGKTIYCRDMAFTRLKKGGIYGNHYGYKKSAYEDWVNNNIGDGSGYCPGHIGEFWISGPKKDGTDRLSTRMPIIEIDEDVREEYWLKIRKRPDLINETQIA